MAIDTKAIVKLREITGAGMGDVREALEEAGGDMEKAIEVLRKKGSLKAAKKMTDRVAGEGLVHAYIHGTGKVGVLVQVGCETDFVARNEDFQALVHDIAIQIAGANPLYIKSEDVPMEVVEKEKEIYKEQLLAEGKPENMIDKIMDGKLEKYYQEVCLLKQAFIKDDQFTVEKVIEQAVAKLGEKIEVVRFTRYHI